jgi:hypothetical protein
LIGSTCTSQLRLKVAMNQAGWFGCIEFSQPNARNWPPRLIAPEIIGKMLLALNVL